MKRNEKGKVWRGGGRAKQENKIEVTFSRKKSSSGAPNTGYRMAHNLTFTLRFS
jgi:hypothetical protein